MTAYEKLRKKYELEASLGELEFRQEELRERIPELKYQKREAEEKCRNASGGLSRLLGRISGKGEEERYALERAVKEAAAALETAEREVRAVEKKLSDLRAEQNALGEKSALREGLSGEQLQQFQHLAASLAAESALHYLRKTRKELEKAQELARNPMMTVGEGQQENIHKANAGALADKCREKLTQIRENGIDFPIHPYIQNPMGYIVTAMRFGDQDRMNSAQEGIRETEKALKELLLQLAE